MTPRSGACWIWPYLASGRIRKVKLRSTGRAAGADSPKVCFARARTYIEQKRNLDRAKALLNEYLRSNLTPDDPSREQAEKLLKEASGA